MAWDSLTHTEKDFFNNVPDVARLERENRLYEDRLHLTLCPHCGKFYAMSTAVSRSSWPEPRTAAQPASWLSCLDCESRPDSALQAVVNTVWPPHLPLVCQEQWFRWTVVRIARILDKHGLKPIWAPPITDKSL